MLIRFCAIEKLGPFSSGLRDTEANSKGGRVWAFGVIRVTPSRPIVEGPRRNGP